MYCILFTVYYVLYTMYCILCTVYYVLYTMYSILCTVYYVLYTMYSILCTVYYSLYTIHSRLCTIYYTILYIIYMIVCRPTRTLRSSSVEYLLRSREEFSAEKIIIILLLYHKIDT